MSLAKGHIFHFMLFKDMFLKYMNESDLTISTRPGTKAELASVPQLKWDLSQSTSDSYQVHE